MNTYYSSNDSFSFKERFFIGKVSARREALPRRRVKSAVAKEDVNSRALAVLDKLGRIRTALTNYLARKDIKSKNRKRVERKLGTLNKAQVALTKALEKVKERGKKTPRRIIRRTMTIINKRVRSISEKRPAHIAYSRYLRALRERAFIHMSPQTLVGLFSLLHNGGSSKGYKDHRGESLDRFGGKRARRKIKDKGGEMSIVRRMGSSLKLTRITHDTRKVPGRFVITAEGKKIQRNKYIRTRKKEELVVGFKIIEGKWIVFDKAGKRIRKSPKMVRHALSGIYDEGLTVAVRGKGEEEIARGPKIAKAPEKRKREKPVTAATPVLLKLPGKKPERPMVAIGKLPKPPEVKIAGITLTPEQTAKIVAARTKLRETLAKQASKPSEIQRDCEAMLKKLPKGTLLTDVSGGVLSHKVFDYLLVYTYGEDARKMEAKLPKMPTAPKVEQPKVKISGLEPKQIAKIVEARAKFIRVLGNSKASPHEIRSGFEVFLSKLPSGIKLLGMKKILHPKTYGHILRIIYGNNEREIIAKLPISDKERFARIMSKVVVPQEAFDITLGAELSALQARIDDVIIYVKGFTARVARQIISDHKYDPKWREKSPSEKGKKAANLVLGLVRNLEKLSAKLESGKDVPAKELTVAFSIFRPGGKARREYLAKVLPKVKTPKKPGARVVVAAVPPAKKPPTVAKKAKKLTPKGLLPGKIQPKIPTKQRLLIASKNISPDAFKKLSPEKQQEVGSPRHQPPAPKAKKEKRKPEPTRVEGVLSQPIVSREAKLVVKHNRMLKPGAGKYIRLKSTNPATNETTIAIKGMKRGKINKILKQPSSDAAVTVFKGGKGEGRLVFYRKGAFYYSFAPSEECQINSGDVIKISTA